MKNPFGTYQPGDGDLPEEYGSPDVPGVKRAVLLLKERDELEKRLAEKTAELARAKDTLQGEITKRQGAEQALREAKENFGILMDYANESVRIIQEMREQFQEDQVQRARGKTLIAAFIHDLKGPLALVSSCCQFCIGNFPHLPPLEDNLKVIYESSQRAINLTKKFLEAFEYQILLVEPVNINEVVTKAWHMVQQDTQSFQVSFEADLGQNLPEVMGNAEALARVLFNLLLNAIQAVSQKGKVIVQTNFLPSENMVEVNVIDDGPGIPKEYRHRIFEPFFTTKEEGTGLGLSICQAIIKQHQGVIHVDCPSGWGTKISVKLPVAQSGSGVRAAI